MANTDWFLIILGLLVAAAILWRIIARRTSATPPPLDHESGHRLDPRAETQVPIPPAAVGHPEPGKVEPAPVVAGPAATPFDVPPPAATPAGPPDTLTTMKGVGPKVAATLNGLGVTRFDQIAAWSDADAERIDAQLGAFKGRVARDQWIEQARLLAAGDQAGFEAKFGKLG